MCVYAPRKGLSIFQVCSKSRDARCSVMQASQLIPKTVDAIVSFGLQMEANLGVTSSRTVNTQAAAPGICATMIVTWECQPVSRMLQR